MTSLDVYGSLLVGIPKCPNLSKEKSSSIELTHGDPLRECLAIEDSLEPLGITKCPKFSRENRLIIEMYQGELVGECIRIKDSMQSHEILSLIHLTSVSNIFFESEQTSERVDTLNPTK